MKFEKHLSLRVGWYIFDILKTSLINIETDTMNITELNSYDIESELDDFNRVAIESTANDIREINLQELNDILKVSKFKITNDFTEFSVNTFKHPQHGKVTTIQASGKTALLIKHGEW